MPNPSSDHADLRAAVQAWIAEDPDPSTAAELTDLVEQGAWDDLAQRFAGTLQFGTAGLRGELGAGPMRMNRTVVIRAAAGLSNYLWDALGTAPVVVIGYDARHGSAQFARDTADVIAGAGGKALLLPQVQPTPLLAFALRHLRADAAVMVTASHNPPRDNGYKVYLGGRVVTDAGQGAQIVPPCDAEIARAIAAIGALSEVPRAAQTGSGSGTVLELGPEVRQAYCARTARLVAPHPRHQDLSIVLTSLHGVGGSLATQVLTDAGFSVQVVTEQAQPDPDFPTVSFPNPEEAGALDLAFATARRTNADLIVANDPDADRCSIAIPDPGNASGWRQLTGDEVGALLGEHIASTATSGTLACSIVSSRLLAAIAQAHGLDFQATLTGFKWISRVPGLIFGYEEALGYCADPTGVRDKDGITAALLVAALAARLKAEGRSIDDALDDLAYRHGVYLTGQVSVRVDELARISAMMTRLRQHPPAELVGSAAQVRDLSEGSEDLPATDALLVMTEAGDRVIARPSGTEPKLKCYLEVIADVREGSSANDLASARARAGARLEMLTTQVKELLGVPAAT
ncbi:MAG: phospho-sugar mutase [Beutenbergiaceae bacterium]